jgi:hypothetical protein
LDAALSAGGEGIFPDGDDEEIAEAIQGDESVLFFVAGWLLYGVRMEERGTSLHERHWWRTTLRSLCLKALTRS